MPSGKCRKGRTKMIYTIENDRLRVQINSLGAELWSVYNKQDKTEYLWQGEPAVWPRRAPTLFPHCGRLKNNRYILDNQSYESSIHGFARDFEHTVEERDNRSVAFEFCDNEETLKKYPYHFRLYTTFQLHGNKLSQAYKVENTNEGGMFFSIGYHTGYKVPFDENHNIEDYSLIFEKNETPVEMLCTKEGLLAGEGKVYFEGRNTIPLNDELFPASFILTNLKSDFVSVVEKGSGRSIKVGIRNFPYVVFWSTPEKIRFVCVEPWFGLPDLHDTDGRFDKKPGIQRLEAGKSFTCSQTIEIGKS